MLEIDENNIEYIKTGDSADANTLNRPVRDLVLELNRVLALLQQSTLNSEDTPTK